MFRKLQEDKEVIFTSRHLRGIVRWRQEERALGNTLSRHLWNRNLISFPALPQNDVYWFLQETPCRRPIQWIFLLYGISEPFARSQEYLACCTLSTRWTGEGCWARQTFILTPYAVQLSLTPLRAHLIYIFEIWNRSLLTSIRNAASLSLFLQCCIIFYTIFLDFIQF